MTFLEQVRSRTRAAHDAAERSVFVTALLDGRLDRRAYVELLRALAPVYRALEQSMRATADEASVALFDHRRLDRYERIRADLACFGQDPDGCARRPVPATDTYVAAVRAAAESPQRLLAHHYTRYLGDMAGGRVIASRMATEYDVEAAALTYYDFSDLGDVRHYRKRYTALLDLVPWSEQEREGFIDECLAAFSLNAALFADLAAATGLAESQDPPAATFLVRERGHSVR